MDKTADIFESSETLYAVCSSLKYNFNVVFTIIFHSFLSHVRLLRGQLNSPSLHHMVNSRFTSLSKPGAKLLGVR